MIVGFSRCAQITLERLVMDWFRFGRILFAIAMMFFGLQYVIFAAALTGPVPGPPWTHGSIITAWLSAVGFLVAGVSLATGGLARTTSLVLGIVFVLFGLIQYGPALGAKPHDPGPWTLLFELLALGGGAFVITANSPHVVGEMRMLGGLGCWLISLSLVVFAVQHFIYGSFVAALIPAWIPARLFWAYFVGVAFVAAALSLVTGKMVSLTGSLLGIMFLIWVLILHLPRVAGSPRNGNEVTSLFIAVAMSGVGFALSSGRGDRFGGFGA